MKAECKSCRFWRSSTTTDLADLFGDCRYDQPKPDSEGCAMWPTTNAEDWCGKFEPKDDCQPNP